MTKRIFITGASGFIGQALVKKLREKNKKLIGLSRNKARSRKLEKIEWVFADIRDNCWHDKIKGCDVVIHLAGVLGYKQIPFKERLSIELDGTRNLVKAVEKWKVNYLVYISTAYSDLGTDYAKAKNICKRYVLDEIKKCLPATVVSPVIVYGPGNDANFSRIIKAVKDSRFVFVGNGRNKWSLIYIDDLVNALVLIINNKKIFLGKEVVISGYNISLRKLVDTISASAQVDKPKIYLPKIPMMFLGRMLYLLSKTGISVPFNYDAILNLVSSRNYKTDRELTKLGFKPKTDFNKGIDMTLNEKY